MYAPDLSVNDNLVPIGMNKHAKCPFSTVLHVYVDYILQAFCK